MSKFKKGEKVRILWDKTNYVGDEYYTEYGVVRDIKNGTDYKYKVNVFTQRYSTYSLVFKESELEKVETPKEILEIGYVVELRSGDFAMVMKTQEEVVFVFTNKGYLRLSYYTDDLEVKINSNHHDIMKIYGHNAKGYLTNEVNHGFRELIWERKEEEIKLTIAEIENKLKIPAGTLVIKENR